jgi:hypothetical protein
VAIAQWLIIFIFIGARAQFDSLVSYGHSGLKEEGLATYSLSVSPEGGLLHCHKGGSGDWDTVSNNYSCSVGNGTRKKDRKKGTFSQSIICSGLLITCTLLVSWLVYFSALKMEVISYSKMLVNFYRTTWRFIPEKTVFILRPERTSNAARSMVSFTSYSPLRQNLLRSSAKLKKFEVTRHYDTWNVVPY